MYKALEAHFGDLGWWPADSPFEVMVGAVLTQNTAWVNVAKAIASMKRERLMTPAAIASCAGARLCNTIRPAGYFRVKTSRLKELCRFLVKECGGRVGGLKKHNSGEIRDKLLSVKGVGPETADSMVLYALGKPVFVVDAYTRRIFSRHGLVPEDIGYEDLKSLVEKAFPGAQARVFNQFHALLVETGKNYCRKKEGRCEECPLGGQKKGGVACFSTFSAGKAAAILRNFL